MEKVRELTAIARGAAAEHGDGQILGPMGNRFLGTKPRTGEILGDPFGDPDPLVAIPIDQAVAIMQANRVKARELMTELHAAKALYEKLEKERKDLLEKSVRDEKVLIFSVNNPV